MYQQISIQQILDFAFVGLVVFTCYVSLFGSGASSRAKRWKDDLLHVEEMLRELIAEAGAASSNLDRSLQRRKEELQQLIRRIEDAKNMAASAPRKKTRPAAPAPDLPNDSWSAPMRRSTAEEDAELAELAEMRADTVLLSQKTLQQKQAETLARRIEVMRNEPVQKNFVGEAVDPVAYKVAARLLAGGQEIHVVSRKLGLPINEVRLIDQALHRKQSAAPAEEPVNSSHIVRSQRQNDIERETALP